jgi:hypothetical protein
MLTEERVQHLEDRLEELDARVASVERARDLVVAWMGSKAASARRGLRVRLAARRLRRAAR